MNNINWKNTKISNNYLYEINCSIETFQKENYNAVVLILKFDEEITKEDSSKNSLIYSDYFGAYYKYIPTEKGLNKYLDLLIFSKNMECNYSICTFKNKSEIKIDPVYKMSEIKNLSIKYTELFNSYVKLHKESEIAQEKRDGHYKQLIYEKEKKKKLLNEIDNLKKKILSYENSLSWNLGKTLVEAKKNNSFFKLPFKLYKVFHNFKKNKKLKNKTNLSKNNNYINIYKQSFPNINEKQNENEILLSSIGWEEKIDPNKLTIMAIFDEFTNICFKNHYNLIQPRPDNWKALIDKYKPSYLFVESAWKGNYGTWQYRVSQYNNSPGQELYLLVNECKKLNIPTIFWNKEDPIHFNNFKTTASYFDFIFTTAKEAIASYEKICNSFVDVLMFAADKKLHNPIKSTYRKNKICFAGSYYSNRFEERRDDQLMLLRSAMDYQLEIYDRNYTNNKEEKSDFNFPEEFSECVIGSLSYEKLIKEYKKYKVFLNVNSIIDSETMFSRRVFELLACGTPIISTYSIGIEKIFGNDIIWNVKNKDEAQNALNELMNNPKEWRKRSLKGIRLVHSNHLYSHRVDYINEKVLNQKEKFPKVLIISKVNDENELNRLIYMINNQEIKKYNLQIKIITLNKELKKNNTNNHLLEIILINEKINDDEAIYNIISKEKVEIISFINPVCVYTRFYLIDMIIALNYSLEIVTAKAKIEKDIYDYTNTIYTDTICINYNKLNYDINKFKEIYESLINLDSSYNLNVYCADSANYHYSNYLISEKEFNKIVEEVEI